MDLTVTVISWNTRGLLDACLSSLRAGARDVTVETHVVDNGSTDGSPDMVRAAYPGVRLIENRENAGFARANNQSWRLARGRYWLLLNSDAEVRPGALDAIVRFMDARPRAGLATARLVNPDGTPQLCAQPAPSIALTLFETARLHKCLGRRRRGRLLLGAYWTYDEPRRVGWTWGTALVARRGAVDEVGPLSEEFHMYGEDADWCLRMRRRGWEVWFCPTAEVVHHGGQSAAQRWGAAGRAKVVSEGYYRAVARDRGAVYARLLRAATALALAGVALGRWARGRGSSSPPG